MEATTASGAAQKALAAPPAYERIEGLHVIRVGGSAYEMGFQHGHLLKAWVPHGPIPYFRTYLTRMMAQAPLGPLAPFAWQMMQRAVRQRVQRAMPGWAQDAIRGVADGAGMNLQELMDGCTMPDALVCAMSTLLRLRGAPPAMQHRLALGLGCTSAIAWGSATVDGSLLHARNFDYFGVESWPKTATVSFHTPTDGQRYVSVVAAGVPLGGATAMNESGLSLTVHQHMFSDQSRLGGLPIGILGDEIMRHARDLDDAERLLREHIPIGCWTYLITDGRRGEVLCWEETPARQVARRYADEERFAYTNIYLDDELGATERAAYGSYWRHNQGRYERTRHRMEVQHGTLDVPAMASILADTGDSSCRLHQAIAMLMTVASVVFRPEDGSLWVASGDAPTSHGRFVPFRLGEQARAADTATFSIDVSDLDRRAFESYRRAYLAWIDHGDLAQSRAHMQAAIIAAPTQSLFHLLAGLLALKAGDANQAALSVRRALDLGHPDVERVASFHLWYARALDLQQRREEARRNYRWVLGHPADRPVQDAALRGLRRPYRSKQVRGIHPDFAFGDVVTP